MESTRLDYSLALGALPRRFAVGKFDVVTSGLVIASKIDARHSSMAEARRDAIKALVR